MKYLTEKEFGNLITKLIQKENLPRETITEAFITLLDGKTSDIQQGAFLAALNAKGETIEEIAGCWKAIYERDTVKANNSQGLELVDNCGTGMDSFKTFNISTAASIVASSLGVPMARHGARAITSVCGTVDIAEALGVDVECEADTVMSSIENTGIGLFNGMSSATHPFALGRILSQIHFGTTLNISASLANPALPSRGVRGVFAKHMLGPVANVMKEIGYKKAIILCGTINDREDLFMDEASVSGRTHCVELNKGDLFKFSFTPEEMGLAVHQPESLSPKTSVESEVIEFLKVLAGNGSKARTDAVTLNAALVLYVAEKADSIAQGVSMAKEAIKSGATIKQIQKWVQNQNRNPEKGLAHLDKLMSQINFEERI